MASVVINGGQSSTNIRNVALLVSSFVGSYPTKGFIYASEVAAPALSATLGNWIDTQGADPYVVNFILSPGVGPTVKTVYVQFANDASGTGYSSANAVSASITLYQNIQLPTITFPVNGTEVTNRSIIVQGTAEAGATVTVKVEALSRAY